MSHQDKSEYALNVDFDELAKDDPEWAAISKSAKDAKWLDFKDPKVVRYACPPCSHIVAHTILKSSLRD